MSTEIKPSNPPQTQKASPPRVPSINLEKALGFMRKVWEHEKRNAAPVPAILTHWGYKAKSSGGFLAVASMKRFGLVDEEGSNEKRTLKLSALALDILKNESLDAAEYQRLLKKAALNPTFHRDVWAKYGEEMPSDATFHNYLVFDKHFEDGAAKQFMVEYKETISFAKLRSTDKVEETNGGQNEGSSACEEKPETAQAETRQQPPAKIEAPKVEKHLPPMTANLRYLPIPLDIGDAPIPVGMSEDDFQLLLDTLNLWKKKIVHYPRKAIWESPDGNVIVTLVKAVRAEDAESGAPSFLTADGNEIPAVQVNIPY